MNDPAAAAIGSPLAGGDTSLGQARGLDARGLSGEEAEPRALDRIELYPEAGRPWIRVLVKGGSAFAVTWTGVPDAASLPGGSYLCRLTPSTWELVWNGEARATPVRPYIISEFRSLDRPLVRAIEATAGSVPAQVVRQQRAGPGSATPSTNAPAEKLAFPLQPDANALVRSQELRDYAWQLLEHFLGAPAIRGRSITMDDIGLFAAQRPVVSAALDRLTQAWAEMQRTHDPTLARFKPMAELLVEQYVFGNETIVLNSLAIRDAPLGLYHRANGLKYYDDHGLPSLDVMEANRRDVFYASQPRPVFRYAPATRDWATMKMLQMAGVDVEIVAVVEGYWANIDVFIAHRLALETGKIVRSMWQQAIAILLFLAAEGLLVLLERIGSPREKLVAKTLHVGLVVTGRFLLIRFVTGLKETLFLIGHHLYRVRRRADGTLDELSQDHVRQAAEIAKPLFEEIIGLLLAGAALRVAGATASQLSPPGGPTSMMFVPATASAGRGSPAAAPPAGAAGISSPPTDFIVVMGTGGRPASTDKPETTPGKQKTPRELEEELFSKDNRPDTPFYLSRLNKTLRKTLQDLLAHVCNPKNQESYKPAGKPPIRVDPEAVNMKTVEFLRQPRYRKLLDRYWKMLTDAQADLNRLRGKVDKKTEKQLEDRYNEIQKFGSGNLGDKRPDKLEFFIERREFATTDASFQWWEDFHNLKHEVYVSAVEAATDMKGAGLELETVPKSRLIEPEPPPETERAEQSSGEPEE